MKLIRSLGTRKIKHYVKSYALFYCDYCKKEVERELKNGKEQHTCGCVKIVKKHKASVLKNEKKQRLCITCNKMFPSTWAGDRRCGKCRARLKYSTDNSHTIPVSYRVLGGHNPC